MGKKNNNPNQQPINDIWHCLEDAQVLAKHFNKTQHNEKRIFHAFTTLAQDEAVGLLAYVIWKGRGRGLFSLRTC